MAEQLYEQYVRLLGPHVVPAVQALVAAVGSAMGDLSSQVMRFFRSLVSPRRPPVITGGPSSSLQELICGQEATCNWPAQQRQLATAYEFSANQPSVPFISGSSTRATFSAIETVQIKQEQQKEDETGFVANSSNRNSVPDSSSFEESVNIPDGNVETVDSNEGNNEHQSDGMLMDDEEKVDYESQDEPTIAVVNYEEEYGAQFIDNSNNQDFLDDGSLDEELENVSIQEGSGEAVDSFVIGSNEDDNESRSRQEVLDEQENRIEAINERDQAGPSIASNAAPLTRRSTRASTAKKVNYLEAMETSVIDQQQQGTLTGTRKRQRTNNAPVHKRLRVQQVIAADEEEDEAEEEAVSLSVTMVHLKCPEPSCKNENFPNKVQLDRHLLARHQIEKFRCLLKGCTTVSFATIAKLKAHRKVAHRRLKKKWPCAQCTTISKTYKQLCTHFSDNHQEGQFGCTAERCNFTERTRKRVRNHQSTKHRQRKYRCTFAGCTLSFNRSSHLADHLLVHNQERPFACGQCTKAFTQKSHLTIHERTHSGLKPYHCTWPLCDYSASDLSNAQGHVRSVHFGLPKSKKRQAERRIVDDREAGEFIEKRSDN